MEIAGKVAVITGAGSGIGRATALRLASLGAKIVVSDVNPDAGAETVKAIQEKGGAATFIRADVASAADVKALVAETLEKYGALDILHNNAGIVLAAPSLAEADAGKMEAVIRINLLGPMLLTQAALKPLAAGQGVVINTASASGLRPWPVDPVYSATKAGVVFFSQALAPQLKALGIRINMVCPGMVRTAMVGHTADGLGLNAEQVEGLSRHLIDPEEIVDNIIALITDDSITGEARYIGKRPLPPEGTILKSII